MTTFIIICVQAYNRKFLNLHTSALKMEAAGSSEIPIYTYMTTWFHNPEDQNLTGLFYSYCCLITKALGNDPYALAGRIALTV
jgi:hypothetical protein